MKYFSKINKEFEKFPDKVYVRKRPTNSYFYLARQLSKCMVRDDAFNFHIDPVRM